MRIDSNYLNINLIKKNRKEKVISFEKNKVNDIGVLTTDSSIEQKYSVQEVIVRSVDRHNKNKFSEFLKRDGKVSYDEYKQIKRKSPSVLVRAYEYVEKFSTCKATPKDVAFIAINLKKFIENTDILNDKKYRVISIGTSPVPIVQALEYLGCEVVYLPISGVRDDYEQCKNNKNMQIAMDYLKQKGISGNEAEDKINILLDFTATGNTLNNIQKFLSLYNDVPEKNIWSVSITEMLFDMLFSLDLFKEIQSKNYIDNRFEIFKNIKFDMAYSSSETVSNVPHFYIDDEENEEKPENCVISKGKSSEEIYQEFEKYSQPLARAYSLCVINELEKYKI